MARSSRFTKRFMASLPMEMYNTLDRLADTFDYASIPHTMRKLLHEGIKRSRKANRVYQEECNKLDVPQHMR